VKRNFLVVASNATVREALAGELRAKGYSVTRAVNGTEAEKIVRTVTVDAVLVESTLPDMSGEELLEKVRQIRPDCRAVILTSFEQVRNTPEQLRFGSGDYLQPLKNLTSTLRLESVVSFKGFVPEAEKVMYLRRSHVSIYPSLKEGWGLTVLEANAYPNLEYGEDFAESAELAGVSYESLLQRIINLGLQYQAPWKR